MPDDEVTFRLAGEKVTALAERALFWAAEKTLLVADVHFGKDATFRRAGRWVPPGTTADDLARLSGLVRRHHVERLVILGDAFHSEHAAEEATLAQLQSWRTDLAVNVLMVNGNHDRRAGEIARRLNFTVVEEGHEWMPFSLHHHHPGGSARGYVLCGHIHPVVSVRSGPRQSLRVPCFWVGPRQCVLPAFGGFTGGGTVKPARGDRVILIAGGKVLEPHRALS